MKINFNKIISSGGMVRKDMQEDGQSKNFEPCKDHQGSGRVVHGWI